MPAPVAFMATDVSCLVPSRVVGKSWAGTQGGPGVPALGHEKQDIPS
jgi:hypothetical protein